MNQKQAIDWLNSQVGQYRDFDGQFQNQCFDTFNFYYQFLTGRNPYTDGYGVSGAKDIWGVATDKFTKIPDSVSLVPQPGDVLIYGPSWGGGYGHVEMVLSSDANGCTIVGSNLTGNPSLPIQRVYRTWTQMSGLIGVLRFNGFGQGEIMDRQAVIDTYQVIRGADPTEEDIRNWVGQQTMNLVRAFRPEANQYKAACNQTITDLRKQLADVKTALANEQSKPPKEVIKTVEKIVEKVVEVPVEVVKEVPMTDATGWAWLMAKIKGIFVK